MRTIPYRWKLSLAFLAVIGIVALANTWMGFSFISSTVVKEAMLRVEMDLRAAWAACEDEMNRLQTIEGMASQRDALRAALGGGSRAAAESDLESLRRRFELDFLTLADASGVVVARSLPPFASGDRLAANPVLAAGLAGRAARGALLLPAEALAEESGELAERARIPLVPTARAAPTERSVETRGLVLGAAFPILDAQDRVLGVLWGGTLLNRKLDLVDRIRDNVFGAKSYAGRPVGTVTLFLGDVRVATNVMLDAGTRALGTRVSREVGEQVLVRGERFADRAFVVNDWYLSGYEPIRDPSGEIIGIVYVGLLEKVYVGYKASLATQFLGVSLIAILVSFALAQVLAGSFRRPIQRLLVATRELANGNLAARVEPRRASRELVELTAAFNRMAEGLETRGRQLQEAHVAMHEAYLASEERNRAYLEMLGFVTHELKSPLASIVFAIASLRDHILGPLNPEQESLLKSAANSADYLHATIANYLNLARIEEGNLRLRRGDVRIGPEIVEPVVARLAEVAAEKGMRIATEIPDDLRAGADAQLLEAVFQNLVTNAVRYGREGGSIRISGGHAEDARALRFAVRNDGEGFSAEAGERLFQKFSRLGRDGTDTKAGTGLGLFVSRQIVEKHGGRMWASSEPGRWAEFSFTLPLGGGDQPE